MSCLLLNNHHASSTPNLLSVGIGGGSSATASSSSTDMSAAGGVALAVVPDELKRLIRIIMRLFYQFELYLCIEMLLIYPCLKEEDLAELLRLDLKLVHQYLINLKKEKFLNEKSIMETSADGKQSKHSYFYINYKMLVNVIKYKLDRIRIQIEHDENQFTTRAQFKCTECGKTYADLDTKDIFITMRCILCGGDVDEDTSALPKQTSRNLMSKFNTQMAPIFDLLSRVEHVRLADCVLRPEPVDMTYVLERMKQASSMSSSASSALLSNGLNGKAMGGKPAMNKYDRWSGDKTRNTDLFGKTQISVNLDSGESNSQTKRTIKELPSIIVQNRTRDEDMMDMNNRDSILLNSVRQAADETLNNAAAAAAAANTSDSAFSKPSSASTNSSSGLTNPTATSTGANGANVATDGASSQSAPTQNLETIIMQKLLKHEKKAANGSTVAADSPAAPDSASSSSNSPKSAVQSASSITINKKRPIGADSTDSSTSSSSNNLGAFKQLAISSSSNGDLKNGYYNGNRRNNYDENEVYAMSKKRKLNNGEVNYLKRNHSDGSASENSSETGGDDFGYYNRGDEFDYTYRSDGDDDMMYQDEMGVDGEDQFIPRVCVQNRPIRFDRITPKLISLMSDVEKEDYIDVCKQLYTEIYEI